MDFLNLLLQKVSELVKWLDINIIITDYFRNQYIEMLVVNDIVI